MLTPLLATVEDNDLTKEDNPPPAKKTSATDPLVILCIALHVLLIVAHFALAVVHAYRYEQRVIVTAGPASNLLSGAVTAVSQLIGTVSGHLHHRL